MHWFFMFILLLSATVYADWPGFLGPYRNGCSAESGLKLDLEEVDVLWRAERGESYASPSIQAGRLIHHHRIGDVERVDCLDFRMEKIDGK